MSKFSFDLDQLPYCCGAWEAGNLTEGSNDFRDVTVSTKKDVVSILREQAEGRPIFINFVQNEEGGIFEDEYECQEVMDAIQGKPDVVDLGTWINPGSGNRIHGFMIKGSNHE